MSNYPNVIETRHLRKCYGDNAAVQDLTLEVNQGEVFGFLGPNGAGKTTFVKMLLGLVAPTSGEGFLFGRPIKDQQVRQKVGFLPEHFRFHDWLNAGEFLQLHSDLYHIPHSISGRRIPELLELVGLLRHADMKLRAFSKGMLQRIGLAQALLNEPELVFLDEPTSGLDPVGRRLVRDIIRNLRQGGTTVFLNSHLLSEVEITCDRVAFIKHGQVIKVSDLQTLMAGELSVQVRLRGITPETLNGLSAWSNDVRQDGEHLHMTVKREEDLPAINRYLVENGAQVFSIRPEHISLEDLFIDIVGTDGGL